MAITSHTTDCSIGRIGRHHCYSRVSNRFVTPLIAWFLTAACVGGLTGTVATLPAQRSAPPVDSSATGSLAAGSLSTTEAEARRYEFSAIPWGTMSKDVRSALEKRGFIFKSRDSTGNIMTFTGNYMGYDGVQLMAVNTDGRLQGVVVMVGGVGEEGMGMFLKMRDIFTTELGMKPVVTVSEEEPYRRGDGRQLEALLNTKATLTASWPESDPMERPGPIRRLVVTGAQLEGKTIILNTILYASRAYYEQAMKGAGIATQP